MYRPAYYSVTDNNFDVYGDLDAETAIVTFGRTFSFAAEALNVLAAEGVRCRLVKLNRVIPVDEGAVKAVCDCKNVFFFEEGVASGGIAEGFASVLLQSGFAGTYHAFGAGNGFLKHAPMYRVIEKLKLDSAGIAALVRGKLLQGDTVSEEKN